MSRTGWSTAANHTTPALRATPPYMVTSRLASELFSFRQTGIGCCLISGLDGAGVNPRALMKCAEWAPYLLNELVALGGVLGYPFAVRPGVSSTEFTQPAQP